MSDPAAYLIVATLPEMAIVRLNASIKRIPPLALEKKKEACDRPGDRESRENQNMPLVQYDAVNSIAVSNDDPSASTRRPQGRANRFPAISLSTEATLDPGSISNTEPVVAKTKVRVAMQSGLMNQRMPSSKNDTALEVHPPMGGRKWLQRKRSRGRWQPIAEHIYKNAGKRRTRRQIASHIQFLDFLLKGDPGWERTTREQPSDTAFHDDTKINVINSLSFAMWMSAPGQPELI
ncbi:hypothetical protein BBP40_000771 [Aspergillus hancockii]|nr:hypothetical protein BBP40_000771 [Aspergillus hancockii]